MDFLLNLRMHCAPINPKVDSEVTQAINCVCVCVCGEQQELNLVDKLQIKPKVLLAYLSAVEDTYRPNIPYHNSIHGADVTQSMHFMMSIPTLKVRAHFLLVVFSLQSYALRSRYKTPVFAHADSNPGSSENRCFVSTLPATSVAALRNHA